MGLGLAILVLAVLASLERPAATNLPDRTGKRVILKSGVVVQPNPAGGHEKVANAATGGSKSEYDRAIADWTEAIRTGPGAPRWWHVSPGPHRQTPPQVIMYERRRHAIDRRGAQPNTACLVAPLRNSQPHFSANLSSLFRGDSEILRDFKRKSQVSSRIDLRDGQCQHPRAHVHRNGVQIIRG